MDNLLLEKVFQERKGHFVHALEVESVSELITLIESTFDAFKDVVTPEEIKEFILSMSIHCTNSDNEDAVYDFEIDQFINENYLN